MMNMTYTESGSKVRGLGCGGEQLMDVKGGVGGATTSMPSFYFAGTTSGNPRTLWR